MARRLVSNYRGDRNMVSFGRVEQFLSIGTLKQEAVGERVCAQGHRIREALARLCVGHGSAARVVGPDFRFDLYFEEEDPERGACMGTLWLQQSRKGGVLPYYRFMLPSLAHDDEGIQASLRTMEATLAGIAAAKSDLHAAIEIPC